MERNKIPVLSHIQAIMHIWSVSEEKTRFRAEGCCMSPVIRDGNIVHLIHGSKDIRTGDVVLYGEPWGYKLHRVVRIDREKKICFLKGDNSSAIDLLPATDILGKALAVEDGRSLVNLNSWSWRLANPVIASVSYLESRIRAQETVLSRIVYRLCLRLRPGSVRFLRPNYLVWKLWRRSAYVRDADS